MVAKIDAVSLFILRRIILRQVLTTNTALFLIALSLLLFAKTSWPVRFHFLYFRISILPTYKSVFVTSLTPIDLNSPQSGAATHHFPSNIIARSIRLDSILAADWIAFVLALSFGCLFRSGTLSRYIYSPYTRWRQWFVAHHLFK